jgi:hypothetical protein
MAHWHAWRCTGCDFLHRRLQIGLVADVVAVEHLARQMPSHVHRDTFGHPCPDQIPRARPAHVVETQTGLANRLRRLGPRLGKLPYLVAVVMEYILAFERAQRFSPYGAGPGPYLVRRSVSRASSM